MSLRNNNNNKTENDFTVYRSKQEKIMGEFYLVVNAGTNLVEDGSSLQSRCLITIFEHHYSDFTLLRALHKSGVDLNTEVAPDETAFTKFIDQNNLVGLRLLLELGANVNEATNSRDPPLNYACNKNNMEAVKIILEESNQNVNIQRHGLDGLTPVLIAAKKKNLDLLDFLIKFGANIRDISTTGLSVLHVYSKKNV